MSRIKIRKSLGQIPVRRDLGAFKLITIYGLIDDMGISFSFTTYNFFRRFARLASTVDPYAYLDDKTYRIPNRFQPIRIAMVYSYIGKIVTISYILKDYIEKGKKLVAYMKTFFYGDFQGRDKNSQSMYGSRGGYGTNYSR